MAGRKADVVRPHELKTLFTNALRKAKQQPGLASYKALPAQTRFHSSKAKGKLMMGGNRVGKTVGGAVESAMRLTGEHSFTDLESGEVFTRTDLPRPPTRGRGVAVDIDRGINLIMIPEIKKWIPSKYLINNSWDDSYNKTHKILTLNNGSTMEFMSYEQDREKFQGTSRHFTWFDEEPPEEIFKECLLRLLDTDGDWWITMTPLIEMSWTYSTLYEPAQKKSLDSVELFEGNLEDNVHVSLEAFDRLTQTFSESEKQTRKSGIYISHTGLVYGESFTRTRNVIPDIVRSSRFEILRNEWSHFQMVDWGYNNPTAILFACYDKDGRIIVYDEIYQNKKLVGEQALDWKIKRQSLRIETEYAVGDPSIRSTDPLKGSSIQSEFGEHGIFVALGNNDVDSGIARVQRMFKEQQLIITERCPNLISELMKYRWDRHLTKARDRKNLKEQVVKKDDHACDALRYGIMSRPRRYEEVDEKENLLLNIASSARDYDWELTEPENRYIDTVLGSEV